MKTVLSHALPEEIVRKHSILEDAKKTHRFLTDKVLGVNVLDFIHRMGIVIKLADSRAPKDRVRDHGSIVFVDGSGIRIATESLFEMGMLETPPHIQSSPFPIDSVSKRFHENSKDRIVEQLARLKNRQILGKFLKAVK